MQKAYLLQIKEIEKFMVIAGAKKSLYETSLQREGKACGFPSCVTGAFVWVNITEQKLICF